MSLVRMHFCTLTARGYGAVSVPTMYGMNGTMPATVNMIDGSEETREALGTTVCSLAAKKSRKRRWISEVRMDVRCPSGHAGSGAAARVAVDDCVLPVRREVGESTLNLGGAHGREVSFLGRRERARGGGETGAGDPEAPVRVPARPPRPSRNA